MPSSVLRSRAHLERLLYIGSLAGIVAIVGLVAYLLAREHSLARSAAVRSSSNIAQMIDADVQRNAGLYDHALLGLIGAIQHPAFNQVPPGLRRALLFGPAVSSPLRGDMLWVNAQGLIIADSLAEPPRQGDFSAWPGFIYLREHDDHSLRISPPFRDTIGSLGWCISFSRRINGADGQFAGVASGALRLDYFNELFRRLNIGQDSSVSLISDEGYILAREPQLPGTNVVGQNFGQTPGMKGFLMAEHNGTFTQVSGIDGKERLYTYSRVGDLPLKVVVGVATAQVFGPWRRTAAMVCVATTVLCVGIFWLALVLTRELSRRQRAERDLAALAMTDGLTGLPNRRRLDHALQLEWLRAQRYRHSVAMLMIDVDHFKAFNERYGHQGGDVALREVAQAIAHCIHRPADLAARYGGEEFAVILAQTDLNGALMIAECIRAEVERRPPAGPGLPRVTVSIGVSALGARPGMPIDGLLSCADQALYMAKAQGRNCVAALEAGLASLPEAGVKQAKKSAG
ncbi:diguanylate cyclase [Pseudomonas sp. NPDC007930]|uniref:sensor domain-containing diguanylate cyclase n=1 Tax=Pseudomonas sp. NPDC007930 TaxID=3364417 RepID=UPI0036F10EA2